MAAGRADSSPGHLEIVITPPQLQLTAFTGFSGGEDEARFPVPCHQPGRDRRARHRAAPAWRGSLDDTAGNQLPGAADLRSEEHTSELQSRENLVCRLLLEKKKII